MCFKDDIFVGEWRVHVDIITQNMQGGLKFINLCMKYLSDKNL